MHIHNDTNLVNGALGGLMLGLSATGFLILTGNITGISFITQSAVTLNNNKEWTISYILGLVSAGVILSTSVEGFSDKMILSNPPSGSSLIAAGLLIGFGSRLGGGCTSGHGLCGLPRRSPRSLAAVLTFMTTGAITAFATRNSGVLNSLIYNGHAPSPTNDQVLLYAAPAAAVVLSSWALFSSKLAGGRRVLCGPSGSNSLASHLATYLCAVAFGVGLGISGMCNSQKVLTFLDFSGSEGWDPSLAAVLGVGVTVTSIGFHALHHLDSAVVLSSSPTTLGTSAASPLKMGSVKENCRLDWKLFVGSALFGVGWGLCGLCPGPALVAAGAMAPAAAKFLPSMFTGMIVQELLSQQI